MAWIGARASDWHSGNPNVKPLAWIGLFVAVAILYYLAAALIGSLLNGSGSPFLG